MTTSRKQEQCTPPLGSCKNLPPTFFMMHLLHRLYGVDAPGLTSLAAAAVYVKVVEQVRELKISKDTIARTRNQRQKMSPPGRKYR